MNGIVWRYSAALLVMSLAGTHQSAVAAPVGTAFTYQGELSDQGVPVSAACDFEFSLWDESAVGNLVGGVVGLTVDVDNGLFTVPLDFGVGVFTGEARWLQIDVCCPSPCSPALVPLEPRQEVTPAPYALHAANAPDGHSLDADDGDPVDAVYVDAEGRVGIGTTTPSQKLTVNGLLQVISPAPAPLGSTVGLGAPGGEPGIAINLGDGAGSSLQRWDLKVETDRSFQLRDSTIGTTRMTVTTDGDVGIGTESPTERLTVTGTVESTTGGFKFPDGTVQTTAATSGGGNTLDGAYDQGGAGAGRSITADAGPVEISGPDGLIVAGTIQSGNSIIIDGSAGAEKITSSDAIEIHTSQGRVARLEPGGPASFNEVAPNVIMGDSLNSVSSGVVGATIAGGGGDDLDAGQGPYPNTVEANWGTIGGGRSNTASGLVSTVGGGGSNIASDSYASVGGGNNNTASGLVSTVGGGVGNIASDSYASVGGGNGNTASGSYASVGGGALNTASGVRSTVGGGGSNIASDSYASVGGGVSNTASGDSSTVVGGHLNTASGSASTVGGGGANTASELYATVGGGHRNLAQADYATIAGGGPSDTGDPLGTRNRVLDDYGTIGGGGNNQAGDGAGTSTDRAYATVGGGFGNTASGLVSTVGGGDSNTASDWSATVGGGQNNTASDQSATVGGGGSNTASDLYATVGGGIINTASGDRSTVGGGAGNTASGSVSTVGGGLGNTASGVHSTVGGGNTNTASGSYSTTPGGINNQAEGAYSFAAGRRAKALNDGSFVWGDSTNADISSNTDNQFTVRATGGARFFSGVGPSTGVILAAGGGSWSSISDKNVKRNIEPIDARELLQRLSEVPIATWNYASQDESIRHIGPMAQDFYAAFSVGEDERYITAIDADGVALAAIQGLHEIVQELSLEKECKVLELEAENAKLAADNVELELRLARVEALLASLIHEREDRP